MDLITLTYKMSNLGLNYTIGNKDGEIQYGDDDTTDYGMRITFKTYIKGPMYHVETLGQCRHKEADVESLDEAYEFATHILDPVSDKLSLINDLANQPHWNHAHVKWGYDWNAIADEMLTCGYYNPYYQRTAKYDERKTQEIIDRHPLPADEWYYFPTMRIVSQQGKGRLQHDSETSIAQTMGRKDGEWVKVRNPRPDDGCDAYRLYYEEQEMPEDDEVMSLVIDEDDIDREHRCYCEYRKDELVAQ